MPNARKNLGYPKNLYQELEKFKIKPEEAEHIDDAVEYVLNNDGRLRRVVELRFRNDMMIMDVSRDIGKSFGCTSALIRKFLVALTQRKPRVIMSVGLTKAEEIFAQQKADIKAVAEAGWKGLEPKNDLPLDVLELPRGKTNTLNTRNVFTVAKLARYLRDANHAELHNSLRDELLEMLGLPSTRQRIKERDAAIDSAEFAIRLAMMIFGEHTAELASNIYIAGVLDALGTLTEREEAIVRQRYQEGLTLEETAQRNGVTRERIRQIEAKAFRKMRHPSRSRRMLVSNLLALIERLDNELSAKKEECRELARTAALLAEDKKPPDDKYISRAVLMTKDIMMLDLSVRSYNCLHRAGINTVEDLLRLDEDELLKVRNLGRKSAEEIIGVVRRFGFPEWLVDKSEEGRVFLPKRVD